MVLNQLSRELLHILAHCPLLGNFREFDFAFVLIDRASQNIAVEGRHAGTLLMSGRLTELPSYVLTYCSCIALLGRAGLIGVLLDGLPRLNFSAFRLNVGLVLCDKQACRSHNCSCCQQSAKTC